MCKLLMTSCMAAMLAGAGGCLVVMSGSSTRFDSDGRYVPSYVLAGVVVGETTRDWLVKNLGEPTRAEKADQDVEKLVYEYTEQSHEVVGVAIVFHFDNETTFTKQQVFELKNGVVQKQYCQLIKQTPSAETTDG